MQTVEGGIRHKILYFVKCLDYLPVLVGACCDQFVILMNHPLCLTHICIINITLYF